eukprot:205896_1
MSSSYPSHWWSFAIAGLILSSCIFIFYWKIIRNESTYTKINDANPNELTTMKTPSMQSSTSAILKKMFRLDENMYIEDKKPNNLVIHIGNYHAEQTTLYQSFGSNDFNDSYHFTQLESYTPEKETNKHCDKRIEAMKEMCQSHNNAK